MLVNLAELKRSDRRHDCGTLKRRRAETILLIALVLNHDIQLVKHLAL